MLYDDRREQLKEQLVFISSTLMIIIRYNISITFVRTYGYKSDSSNGIGLISTTHSLSNEIMEYINNVSKNHIKIYYNNDNSEIFIIRPRSSNWNKLYDDLLYYCNLTDDEVRLLKREVNHERRLMNQRIFIS